MFKKMIFLLIFSVAFVGCQKEKPVEKKEVKTVKQYTIEQFRDTESIFGHSFSADEKTILFSSNKTGVYNAYTMPVNGG